MKKSIIFSMSISILLLIIITFLIYSTKYIQTSIKSAKISQEYTSKIEHGNNLIEKRLLLSTLKKHNNYVNSVIALNNSYANALEKTYFGLIFLILIQLLLLYRVLKATPMPSYTYPKEIKIK